VSQQPAYPVFCFEAQKLPLPASSFLPDIKVSWRNLTNFNNMLEWEATRQVSSSNSFVGCVFSFYVLTQDCKLKFLDRLWYTFRKADKCFWTRVRFSI